ncbi:MAG: hypothetical protein ACI80V_000239 [Rhodothermales bacterium]|jgi:hypothetical protein
MRLLSLFLLLTLAACSSPEPDRWLRGNLHTHSFWSDGDDFPEAIIQRYVDEGYDFIALSDHNTLAEGDRWIEVNEGRRAAFEKYVGAFGSDWVDTRDRHDTLDVRLRTFAEYSARFDSPDSFLVIQSEEITDGFEGKSIHVNATNIAEHIHPQGGESVTDAMQRNINAVLAQRAETGQPMVPHINHPNFGWAITPDDLVPLTGEHFFEVYNGHPAVHNEGDDDRPGTESMWDYINTARLADGNELLYGLAVDDAHNYQEERVGLANVFRGWVMVRSQILEPGAIVEAMERGDFYGSSGVTLSDVVFDGKALQVHIAPKDGVSYVTHFVGTRTGGEPGQVFQTTKGTTARFELAGDELFVRATIISDELMPNPYREGETEKAWTQPVRPY